MEFEFKNMLQALKSVLSPELSKHDFVCHFFGLIMDPNDSQEPFYSETKEKSSAEKLFDGRTNLTKQKAQIVVKKWYQGELEDELWGLEDHQVDFLISELSLRGLSCTRDDYVEKICAWLFSFFQETAKSENKKTKGMESKAQSTTHTYNDNRIQTVCVGTIVNQYGSNSVNTQSIDTLVLNFRGNEK